MDITSPELLKNWKTYTLQNKITQPTAKDVFGFLKAAGISEDLIEKAFQRHIDLSKVQQQAKIAPENKKFSDEQQEGYFNQLIVTLKKMNKAQLQDLISELKNG
jgi:hypothetical protein